MEKLKIRRLTSNSDFEKCVSIQREAWKHDDIYLTPVTQYRVSVETGAILLGAFVKKKMAGFVYSFPAIFEKRLCQHSHILAVLPQYKGCGIGKELKWAQRDWALKGGYNLVTWTFDPLKAKNANLNFHTLGAVSKTYLPNFYGSVSSLTFGPNMPTDRIFLEWPLKEERVRIRRKREYEAYDLAHIPKVLERELGKDRNFYPVRPLFSSSEKFLLVEILQDINALRKEPAIIMK